MDHERQLFLGFVGVTDILRAFVGTPSEELLLVRAQLGPDGSPGAPGEALMAAGAPTPAPFVSRPLASIAGRGSDGHLLLSLPAGSGAVCAATEPTLLTLVRSSFLHSPPDGGASAVAAGGAAASGWPVCHRAALVMPRPDGSREIAAIVSQSDVIRLLHEQHNSPLSPGVAGEATGGPVLSRTLAELGLGAGGVACVAADEPALGAFARLSGLGASCVGVCDGGGALVAALSASDLRAVLPCHWGVLAMPVRPMLELQCGAGWGLLPRPGGGAVTLRPGATLGDAVGLMVAHSIHHVFVRFIRPPSSKRPLAPRRLTHSLALTHPSKVVDAEQAPLGVVSTTDVLRAVAAGDDEE